MNMIDITPIVNAAIEAAVNQLNGGNLPLE